MSMVNKKSEMRCVGGPLDGKLTDIDTANLMALLAVDIPLSFSRMQRYIQAEFTVRNVTHQFTEQVLTYGPMTNQEIAARSANIKLVLPIPAPKQVPIRSSDAIMAVAFDQKHSVADVTLQGSGKTYRYSGFTLDLLLEWLAAESLGKFYNRRIRGVLPSIEQ